MKGQLPGGRWAAGRKPGWSPPRGSTPIPTAPPTKVHPAGVIYRRRPKHPKGAPDHED